ncbi:hypothetical protein ACFP3T_09950 [Lactiplantibacillus dongliensis]|uniref:Uncharacterized protein n=1 Tax=Lactiplantibacillus dongliensis TaxID=2559919 RepID=A0ABW1R8C5_9LACO|nr:hypothetical protein [Lactiplantibacillus dongliensis]
MTKRILKIVGFLLLLGVLIGGGLLVAGSKKAPTTTHPATASSNKQPKKITTPKPVAKLTMTELKRHPDLRYSSIIYYGIKYTHIQRWQEVSDFSRGWQVEIYHAQAKYLVWPDKHIKAEAKQLEPNWFKLDPRGNVTYHSFVVHSFRDDQTKTVNLTEIVAQINHDHAMKKVRQMPTNLTTLNHTQ